MKEFLKFIDKDISRCNDVLKENNYLEIVIAVEEITDKYKEIINNLVPDNDRIWNYSKRDLENLKDKLILYRKKHISELMFKSVKEELRENKEISLHKLEEVEFILDKIEEIHNNYDDINEKWIKIREYINWLSKEDVTIATNILRIINIVLNID